MTPDPNLIEPAQSNISDPATGMTTKVVKGSLWALVGQMAPVAVSFVTTPFVIRMLGAESYGVYILIGLIPSYFGFADFGMGLGSTKFASDAYAHGDLAKEGRIVRTAALIAFCSSVPVALVLFFFSSAIIGFFNVPPHQYSEAALGLKLAAITFALNLLNNVLSTPQLVRLRMDLNMLISGGFKTLGILAVPFGIFVFGIVGGILALTAAAFLTLLGHLVVWKRLTTSFRDLSIDRESVKPLLKFGAATVGAAVAAMFLLNIEKGILAATVSTTSLAHYSVAFNLASMMTMFSGSMIQSLLPAFSQMQHPARRGHLNSLYSRGIRINLIWLIPALGFLALVARPFFAIWAGKEFAVESPGPFYVLLIGVAFNIIAFLPAAAIISAGRTDVLALLYWIELAFYSITVWLLASQLGAFGAAIAWTLRVTADAILQFLIARKLAGTRYTASATPMFAVAAVLMSLPFAASIYFGSVNLAMIAGFIVCLIAYAGLVWKTILHREEASWLIDQFSSGLSRLRTYG